MHLFFIFLKKINVLLQTVRIWQIRSGKLLRTVYVSQTTSIMAVNYSNGYFACCFGNTICLYAISDCKLLYALDEHQERWVALGISHCWCNSCGQCRNDQVLRCYNSDLLEEADVLMKFLSMSKEQKYRWYPWLVPIFISLSYKTKPMSML